MAICMVCHNDYDKAFEILMDNQRFTFDCFECAIQKLAPQCAHCECKIIGHGIEAKNKFYCCAHCARQKGIKEAHDHVNG